MITVNADNKWIQIYTHTSCDIQCFLSTTELLWTRMCKWYTMQLSANLKETLKQIYRKNWLIGVRGKAIFLNTIFNAGKNVSHATTD